MKTLFGLLLFTLSLCVRAQGVMPVPTGLILFGNTCEQNQSFDILSDPLLRPFQINLTSLICNDESLYADAFSFGANYQHNRVRCDEISTCSQSVSPEDLKDADAIISQNIPTVAYLSALTKAVEAGREYNAALYQYEKKHKTKVCAEESIDFNCDHQMRMALATVADSLVDFPEYDRAPLSKDDLLEFIPGKFFGTKPVASEKSLEDLKKDCSKKFSLKNVCSQAAQRIETVKKCDQEKTSKNCFDEEQRAWASLTNDFKNSNKQLYLAIEKQLCLPQRMTKSATQSTFQAFSPLLLRSQRSRVLSDQGFARTQQLISTAKLNSEKDDSSQPESSVPRKLDAKEQESFTLGDGLNRAARDSEFFGADSKDTVSLSDTFSENVKQVLDKNNNLLNTVDSHQNSNNWNTDVLNRARELAEEQKIQEEERKRRLAEDEAADDDIIADSDKKNKQDEISSLTAQIDGLKSKLETMTERMDELKSKKESTDEPDEANNPEALKREKEILELKKQIAQLEADKKKKEEETRLAKVAEEVRIERERTEKNRSYAGTTSAFSSQPRNAQGAQEHTAESMAAEREKTSRSIASAYESSGGRSPASLGASAAPAIANQLILKAVGSQATPESNIVYMTPTELQRYPYRLSGNASSVEIEKMLEGNQGSTIILGESEQIVPIIEKGKILYDEQGKIKYKRIKIALVKNDKERTQQIAREISSLADLKKEEQKKRDLIRYQEMKKAIKVP